MIVRNPSEKKCPETALLPDGPDARLLAGPLSSSQWTSDDGNWMITLCDLTFLLIGFLVVWYVTGKNNISSDQNLAQVKPAATTSVAFSNDKRFLVPHSWEIISSEIQGYVKSLALESDVELESGNNEVVVSLKDTVSFD